MGDDITIWDEMGESKRYLREYELEAAKIRGQWEAQTALLDRVNVHIADARSEIDILEQVTTLLQGLEASWNKQFQTSVAKVISRGLTLVFEEPMELRIVPKVRGDVTTVDFKIVQGEGKNAIETDIMGAKGGTVVALVNVLIRALLILSSRPPLRRLLILDEPFGLADDQYIPAFGSLLRELCDKLGFQIIVVSHEAALVDMADTAYEIYKVSDKKGNTFRQLRSRNEVRT